ncbi:MAG: hypothetical protein MUO72_09855 [Bacteroidales bacterium]|nr:hypothetical protein [Bacteroidales bacterium]
MRNNLQIHQSKIVDNQEFNTFTNLGETGIDLVKNNPLSKSLAAEGRENFFNYIEWLGLDKNPDLIVISSHHHYYYDAEEMKKIKTVINLIELNQMKEIRSFLHSIFHILPPDSNFIGCFVDNKKKNGFVLRENSLDSLAIENDIVSRNPFLNMIYSIMDSRINKYMSGRNVTLLLEDHGFKVLDMTELNGLTYFRAKKF